MKRGQTLCGTKSGDRRRPQASPHFFRRDFNKLEIGQSVGRSIVVAPRGWPSFSFSWFRAGGNERRVNIRLLQMLMVHVGVKNEGIREGWYRRFGFWQWRVERKRKNTRRSLAYCPCI